MSVSILSILLILLAPMASQESASAPPHVIIILADDLGQGDLGVMNPDSRIPTPNLDRLAIEGARFTDAHSPSAVCTPTRYALLTGRYCWRSSLKSGVLWGRAPLLIEDGRPTIASELDQAGYHTAFVGKWHLGLGRSEREDWNEPFDAGPHTVGFNESMGIPSSLDIPPYCWVRNGQAQPPPNSSVEKSEHRRKGGGGFWRKGPASPGFDFQSVLPTTIDESMRIVREHSNERSGEPLFMYVALSAPHTPWLPLQSEQGTTPIGHYGDFVASVDAQVGRLLKALETSGLSENTLLVFTSDNGAHWPESDIKRWSHDGNNQFRGQKADIHEGGHRVPLLVRWPGVIEPGTTHTQTVCLSDLYETTRSAAGLDKKPIGGEDSFDLMPLLRTRKMTETRPAIIHHSLDGMFAIRKGQWKLIEGLGSGGFTPPKRSAAAEGQPDCQLYDLAEDPSESNSVAVEHPKVVEELRALLQRYREAGRSVSMAK